MRDLEEHARAVAGVALQAGAAAVLQVDQDGERVVQGLVAALALEVGDGADAAGVVLVGAAVEARLAGGLLQRGRGAGGGLAGAGGGLAGCELLAHGTPLKTVSRVSLGGVPRLPPKRDQVVAGLKRARFSPDKTPKRARNWRETRAGAGRAGAGRDAMAAATRLATVCQLRAGYRGSGDAACDGEERARRPWWQNPRDLRAPGRLYGTFFSQIVALLPSEAPSEPYFFASREVVATQGADRTQISRKSWLFCRRAWGARIPKEPARRSQGPTCDCLAGERCV